MKNLTYFLLSVFFTLNTNILAQPELDTTFASTGKTILQFGTTGMTQDMIVQPDNKTILIGGPVNTFNFGSFVICLIRLNEDGSFDTTFGGSHGNTGYVYTNPQGFSSLGFVKSVAMQSDGKLIAISSGVLNSASGVVMIRYNSNGSIDSTFGNAGVKHNPVNAGTEVGKITVQPDGKIVIVGYTGSFPNYQQFVARYLPDGSPDHTFGKGGIAAVNIPGYLSAAFSVGVQADGKIITGGSVKAVSDGAESYLLTRLNKNGSPDPAFDGDGFRIIGSGSNLLPGRGFVSLGVQSDGRILALGSENILYRFNLDGSLDTDFDTDGSRFALDGISDPYYLVVTPSGKITVAGNPSIQQSFPNIDYRTARYRPDGSPDPTYSQDGFLDIDLTGIDGAVAASLDSQGRIVIGGRSGFGGTSRAPWTTPQFSAVRLVARPSQNVGFSGRVTDADEKPVRSAYLTLRSGSQIIAVGRTNPFGFFRFQNIPSGQTYTLSVFAKGSGFTDRSVLVDDEITNYRIVSED